jgi:hypothetical protein
LVQGFFELPHSQTFCSYFPKQSLFIYPALVYYAITVVFTMVAVQGASSPKLPMNTTLAIMPVFLEVNYTKQQEVMDIEKGIVMV